MLGLINMDHLYIYIGHSSFGSPKISQLNTIPSDLSELNQYMWIKIPDNFTIITFCSFKEKTNVKTTNLLFGAMKNSSNFSHHVKELLNYHDISEKQKNIMGFSRVLVSNFLIWIFGKKTISDQTIYSCLKPMFSENLIQKIKESWETFAIKEKSVKAWSTGGFIAKLHQFDFITEDIIDLVLEETKINISVYKPGDMMKFMNFDELSVFNENNSYSIYSSGIDLVDNYKTKNSPIHKKIKKELFNSIKKPEESDEMVKLRVALEARSNISIERKFPRYFDLTTIFDKFDSGTFIIPSCGSISIWFEKFFDTNSIDTSQIDFFK